MWIMWLDPLLTTIHPLFCSLLAMWLPEPICFKLFGWVSCDSHLIMVGWPPMLLPPQHQWTSILPKKSSFGLAVYKLPEIFLGIAGSFCGVVWCLSCLLLMVGRDATTHVCTWAFHQLVYTSPCHAIPCLAAHVQPLWLPKVTLSQTQLQPVLYVE